MQISQESITRACTESEIYNELLALDNSYILELGCGAARHTREIACAGTGRKLVATEVDQTQHAENLKIDDLPNVRFENGGAEIINAGDNHFDYIMMFKSLHHVPKENMPAALREIHRVLKPNGLIYISEPLFSGDFNEVLRLFHDEEAVREAAFSALQDAVQQGLFALRHEVFFNSTMEMADFNEFEKKIIGATHTEHHLSDTVYASVKERFNQFYSHNQGRFTVPIRVDVLAKV